MAEIERSIDDNGRASFALGSGTSRTRVTIASGGLLFTVSVIDILDGKPLVATITMESLSNLGSLVSASFAEIVKRNKE